VPPIRRNRSVHAGRTAAICQARGKAVTAVSPLGGPAGPTAPESAAADDAFRALYERHSSCVFGYCLKWLRSREEAEDAAQTTFFYAMRGLRRGIVPTYDEAWLLAIARNVCRNRTAVTRRRAVEVVRDPQLLAESVAAPARSDDLAGLAEALNGLTAAQRRAILLREWQGLSYREIAEELDLSQAAVETLLFRARRALAARLRGAGSFLPWLKAFAGGGAGSLAVGATVVAVTAVGTIAGSRPGGSVRQPAPAARSGVQVPQVAHVAQVAQLETRPQTTPPLRRRAAAPAHTPAAASIATPAVPATAQPRTPTATGVPQQVSDTTQAVAAAAKPVADSAGSAAQTVLTSATDAVSAIETVVPGAVATTTDAAAGAVSAVTASVPAISTDTAGSVVSSLPPVGGT
jgi:RNA polymerase sigma factor (sigma-70 family)